VLVPTRPPAFKHYIADYALTDTRCFPSINSAGTLRGGLAGPIIHTPEVVDGERAGYCGAQDSFNVGTRNGVGLVVSSTSIGTKFRYLKLERVSKEPEIDSYQCGHGLRRRYLNDMFLGRPAMVLWLEARDRDIFDRVTERQKREVI
jgi:hypothetical protein